MTREVSGKCKNLRKVRRTLDADSAGILSGKVTFSNESVDTQNGSFIQ